VVSWTVRHANADGLQQPHGIFETGLRCFWRAVVADIVEDKNASHWPEFARLRTLVRNLVTPVPISLEMQHE